MNDRFCPKCTEATKRQDLYTHSLIHTLEGYRGAGDLIQYDHERIERLTGVRIYPGDFISKKVSECFIAALKRIEELEQDEASLDQA
ncbi:MAG: hypothetical protein ACXABY_02825 [Candidatus Thorarchaeota archaeon]|jgi:hypothetical protein